MVSPSYVLTEFLNSQTAQTVREMWWHFFAWSNGFSMILLAHVLLKPMNFNTFPLFSLTGAIFHFADAATDYKRLMEVDFVQIANFKKDSKTCVKLMILLFLRRPNHQNIQFYTGFVSFFDIVNFHKIDLLLVASN